MALTTIVNLGLVASLTKQVATEEYASHPLKEGWEFNWATGTGEDQANSVFHVAGTAAAGVPVVLDLLGGGLTDAFGDAIAFTSLKAIFIRNTSTTDVNLLAEGTVGFFVTTGQVLLPGGAGADVFDRAGLRDHATVDTHRVGQHRDQARRAVRQMQPPYDPDRLAR